MKKRIVFGTGFLIAALSFGYMSLLRNVDTLTMNPETDLAIAEMGNEVTLSTATLSGGSGDTIFALARGGAPEDTRKFRLVEGNGILLWVDRSLRFRGKVIDLDIGFINEGMIVYATNFIPAP